MFEAQAARGFFYRRRSADADADKLSTKSNPVTGKKKVVVFFTRQSSFLEILVVDCILMIFELESPEMTRTWNKNNLNVFFWQPLFPNSIW